MILPSPVNSSLSFLVGSSNPVPLKFTEARSFSLNLPPFSTSAPQWTPLWKHSQFSASELEFYPFQTQTQNLGLDSGHGLGP